MMCKIVPFAATLSVYVSIITLVAISLDRYYVILYPFRQKLRLKQCIIILFLIWIVSILMSLFKLVNYEITYVNYDDDFSNLTTKKAVNTSNPTTTTTTTTTTTSRPPQTVAFSLLNHHGDYHNPNSSNYMKHKVCGPLNDQLDGVEIVFLAIMQYIVPFFIISFTYFRIGYHIYFDDSPSSVTQNQSANKRKVNGYFLLKTINFLKNFLIFSLCYFTS